LHPLLRHSSITIAESLYHALKRLEDSCPTHTYRCVDAEFRDRMRRAYSIAVTVCLNMRAGLARIRMAKAFKETSHHFAGPVAKMAIAAYLCGRAEGRDGAEADAGPVPSNCADLAKLLTSDVRLQDQLDEIRSVAEEVVGQIADVLSEAVGRADAVDLLSQWQGFGRFCRSRLGLEPAVVTEAFGLGQIDVGAELAQLFPGSAPDKSGAARWAKQWSRGWERRFERV
jgi:hypothetical protein